MVLADAYWHASSLNLHAKPVEAKIAIARVSDSLPVICDIVLMILSESFFLLKLVVTLNTNAAVIRVTWLILKLK